MGSRQQSARCQPRRIYGGLGESGNENAVAGQQSDGYRSWSLPSLRAAECEDHHTSTLLFGWGWPDYYYPEWWDSGWGWPDYDYPNGGYYGSGPYTGYWYYCADPPSYYPYVTQCNTAWQTVPAS